jgi:hypothetical protein
MTAPLMEQNHSTNVCGVSPSVKRAVNMNNSKAAPENSEPIKTTLPTLIFRFILVTMSLMTVEV